MPGVDFANDKERESHIAIAQAQGDGSRAVASQHARSIIGQAMSQVDLITGESLVNTDQIDQTASVEAQATTQEASIQASILFQESNLSTAAEYSIAADQAAYATSDAGYEVNQIGANARAFTQTESIDASIRSTLTGNLAALSARTTASEAAIRVSTILATARIGVSTSLAEARVRADGVGKLAAIRVRELLADTANQVRVIDANAIAQANEAAQVALLRANETNLSTGYQVDAIGQEAGYEATATRGIARTEAAEIVTAANTRARGGHEIAAIDAAQDVTVATTQADSRRYGADQDHVSATYVTDRRYDEEIVAADSSSTSTRHRADTEYRADLFTADRNFQVDQYEADRQYTGKVDQATARAANDKYDSQSRYTGVVHHEAAEDQRQQIVLAFAEKYFEQFWGYLTSGKLTGPGSGTPGFMVTTPVIPTSGVYPPSLIRAEINRAKAASDVRAYSDYLALRDDAAGRGVGGHAPFVAAGRVAAQGQALLASTKAQAKLNVSLRAENVKATTQGQGLRADVFADQQQAYVESEANAVRRQVGVIEGVFRIIGSIT